MEQTRTTEQEMMLEFGTKLPPQQLEWLKDQMERIAYTVFEVVSMGDHNMTVAGTDQQMAEFAIILEGMVHRLLPHHYDN